ncbi:hypothetical protein [Enterococcus casseliflavus]
METNFNLKQSRTTLINFSVPDLSKIESMEFKFTFDLGINEENPNLARVNGVLKVGEEDNNESCFLTLKFSGIYEGENTNPQLKFDDMSQASISRILKSLIIEIEPLVKELFMSSMGMSIDLQATLKKDFGIVKE